jgi:hypothetical protein
VTVEHQQSGSGADLSVDPEVVERLGSRYLELAEDFGKLVESGERLLQVPTGDLPAIFRAVAQILAEDLPKLLADLKYGAEQLRSQAEQHRNGASALAAADQDGGTAFGHRDSSFFEISIKFPVA